MAKFDGPPTVIGNDGIGNDGIGNDGGTTVSPRSRTEAKADHSKHAILVETCVFKCPAYIVVLRRPAPTVLEGWGGGGQRTTRTYCYCPSFF